MLSTEISCTSLEVGFLAVAEESVRGFLASQGKGGQRSLMAKADSTKQNSGGSSKVGRVTAGKFSLKNSKTSGKPLTPEKVGTKTVPKVEPRLGADLPKNVKILIDCEAASILEGIQDHLQMLSDDPKIVMPESFAKALRFTQSLSQRYTHLDDQAKALQKLKKVGATDAEICMISNIGPETDDEVYALVPSLKGDKVNNQGPIREALAELAKLKQPDQASY